MALFFSFFFPKGLTYVSQGFANMISLSQSSLQSLSSFLPPCSPESPPAQSKVILWWGGGKAGPGKVLRPQFLPHPQNRQFLSATTSSEFRLKLNVKYLPPKLLSPKRNLLQLFRLFDNQNLTLFCWLRFQVLKRPQSQPLLLGQRPTEDANC